MNRRNILLTIEATLIGAVVAIGFGQAIWTVTKHISSFFFALLN